MFQNQESQTIRRSNEKPRVKEHIKICSKSYTLKPPCKIIKSVQTALSSIDLITVKRKRYRKDTRKIKSHENIYKMRKGRKQEEILEWLHDVYQVKKVKYWSEKLQRIAEKLKKPGGEKRLRTKIERYLQTVSSQFSDYDEDVKEFREHLPDHIIKKFKVYLKKDKVHSPKNINGVESNLKAVISRWLVNVPLKKEDFLSRPIKKEDIADSLAQRIEPFVLHRPNSDNDFKCMLKSYSMQIVNEIPIEINDNVKKYYVDKVTDALVDDLMNVTGKKKDCKKLKQKLIQRSNNNDYNLTSIIKNLERPSREDCESSSEEAIQDNIDYCQYDNVKQHALKATKDFVTDEITMFLEETESGICRKRMGYLEVELSNIFMDAIRSMEHYFDENVKEDIRIVLENIGSLSENQVKYFTHSLYKHFTQKFLTDFLVKSNLKPGTFGNDYLENYFVLYNPTHHNKSMTRDPSFFSDIDNEENINSYTNKIANQIDEWLMLLHIQTPFARQLVFREMAIGDLARDIVNRRKYLAQNPYNKNTDEEELDYLKFQIFIWIGKLVGDQNIEIAEFAPDLMRRIESVPFSVLTSCEDIETVKTPKYDGVANSEELTSKTHFDQLKGEIFTWLQEMPPHLQYCDDDRTRYQFVENLLDRIELGIKLERNIHTVVDTEVDFWIKKALTAKPSQDKITGLKDIIKGILYDLELYTHDIRLQVEATKSNTENTGDITSDEFDEEFKLFTAQVAQIIDEWLTNLIPQVKFKSQKVIAVNGLAADIVDKYKHNILFNSRECRGKYVDLEDLKYQVFKWMKRLVGDDIVVVIEHCSKLMIGIQTIRRPSLTKTLDLNLSTQWSVLTPKDKETGDIENISTNNYVIDPSIHHQTTKPNVGSGNEDHIESFGAKPQETQTGKSTIQLEKLNDDDLKKSGHINVTTKSSKNNLNAKNIGSIYNSNSEPNCNEQLNYRQRDKSPVYIKNQSDDTGRNIPLNQVPIFGRTDYASKTNDNSYRDKFCSVSYTSNPLVPNETEVYSIMAKLNLKKKLTKEDKDLSDLKASRSFSVQEDTLNVPKGMTVSETYQHFDKIFKEKIQELSVAAATGEQKSFAEVARNGIYNGIWKTYFKLKSDPNTENDYGLFECIFEDELDSLLDCLPQTPELKAIRHGWKLKVLQEILNMLKYIHITTDAPSFRQHLTKKFNRKFLKNRLKEYSDQLQYAFVSGAADAFILYTRFKNDDPMKANIYRKRLMKRLQDLAEYVKRRNDVEFRFIDQNQLCQEAFRILGSIQVPNDETLNSEVDDILYSDEIEQWYAELPLKINTSVFDDLMNNKLIDFLSKKLHDIEKHKNPDDPTVEREMKHEISKFLEENSELQPDERLNINYMVDALTNRLRNRRLDALGYNTFEKEKPFSSTFTQPKPSTIFTPIVNQPIKQEITKTSVLNPQFEQPAFGSEVLGTSQVGPSAAHYRQDTRPSTSKPQSEPFSSFTHPKPTTFTPLVNQAIKPGIPITSILKSQFEQHAFNSEVLGTSQAGPSTAKYGQGTRPRPLTPQSEPFSSFTQPKPATFTPLANQPIRPQIPKTSILNPRFEQPAFNSEVLGTSQVGPSSANYGQGIRQSPLKPPSDQRFTAKHIVPGILGTSQVAGPTASIGYGPPESRPEILGNTVQEVPEPRTNVTSFGSPTVPTIFGVDQSYGQGLGSIRNYARAPVNQGPLDQIETHLAQGPMGSKANELIPIDEELEEDDEIVRCSCMERTYRSRRKRFYCLDEDLERYPCLYEMVHPHSYYDF